MSKTIARAFEKIVATVPGSERGPTAAVGEIVMEFHTVLARIALALEEANKRPTITAMGEGSVVGELAHFEPVIAPEQVDRALKALELIAAKVS